MPRQHRPDQPQTHQPTRAPGRPGPLVVNLPAARADTKPDTTPDTTPAPAAQPPDLRLPHERDQSGVDTTADTPDPLMVQAAKDLAAGQVDTDLHNAPGLDAQQRERLLRRGR